VPVHSGAGDVRPPGPTRQGGGGADAVPPAPGPAVYGRVRRTHLAGARRARWFHCGGCPMTALAEDQAVPRPPRRLAARVIRPALVCGLLIACWCAASDLLVDPGLRFLLPAPNEVVQVAFLDPYSLQELLRGLAMSAKVALIGLGFAVVIGL